MRLIKDSEGLYRYLLPKKHPARCAVFTTAVFDVSNTLTGDASLPDRRYWAHFVEDKKCLSSQKLELRLRAAAIFGTPPVQVKRLPALKPHA